VFTIIPDITLIAPEQNYVDEPITLTGTGYKDGEVAIHFGTKQTITTTMTSAYGTFSTTFLVNAQIYGSLVITAQDAMFDTTTFTILNRIIKVSPAIVFVGEVVTVEGTGYGYLEDIAIDFGTQQTITTTTSTTNGTFSATFLASTQSYGLKRITAGGTATPLYQTEAIYLDSRIIILNPGAGALSTIVTDEGTGFGIEGTLVRIDFGTHKTITTTTASLHGTFSATFIVDQQPEGSRVITATSGVEFATTTFVIQVMITYLSPTTGFVGDVVTVKGAGYTAGNEVRIDFGTKATITTTTAGPNGTFSATFIVNFQPYSTKQITAIDNTSGKEAETFNFYLDARITLITPTTAFVGDVVTVEGTGFGSETVQIDFGTKETIATTLTSTNGTFSTTFIVNFQPYSTKQITATGLSSAEVGTTNNFYLDARITLITPTTAFVGDILTLQGTGYGYQEEIGIDFGTLQTITTITTSTNGTFSVTFAVNTQAYSTKTITATGAISSEVAITTNFYLDAQIILFTPTEGSVGDVVTVEGTGYGNVETIRIDFGTHKTITTSLTSQHGTFSTTFRISTQNIGTQVVTATGIVSNEMDTSTFCIKVRITLVKPISGQVGDIVTVEGTGYSTGQEVRISFGTLQTITTTMASGNGTFSTTFMVNTQGAGSTTITATDITSTYSLSEFKIIAKVTLVAPSEGWVGTITTVIGTGYGKLDTVAIHFGTKATITTTLSSENGTFSTTFIINTQPWGTTRITAVSVNKNTSDYGTITILGRLLWRNPNQGPVGTTVRLFGNGFSVGEVIRIDFGITNTITTAIGQPDGTFTAQFLTDAQEQGTKVITVIGLNSGQGGTDIFEVISGIGIAPEFGVVGSIVVVGGNGFNNNNMVAIHFGTDQTVTTATANGIGIFTGAKFKVSTQPGGTTIITAKGVATGQGTAVFYIIANITFISPISGNVGQIVTVAGDGFGSGTVVTIDFGTHLSITTTIASQEHGTFLTTFVVDTQPEYVRAITASDGLAWYQIAVSAVFEILPDIILLTPQSGFVGDVVTVEGRGYSELGLVQIDFGTHQTITTILAGANGTFSTTFIVSTQTSGTKVITSWGSFDTTTFVIMGQITIFTPTTGYIGQIVTIEGTGFGSETVRIDFGTHQTITTTLGSENGTFSTTFTIDTQQRGQTVITTKDISGESDTTCFEIFQEIILLSPTKDVVGKIVTVEGRGYKKGQVIRIDFGTHQTITTTIIVDCGTFSITFMVNTQGYGSATITAEDEASNLATTTFAILSEIKQVNPQIGRVGSLVILTGDGVTNNGLIVIHFGTHQTITTTIASGNGTFSVTFIVSAQRAQTHIITAVGSIDTDVYYVIPEITALTPTEGPVSQVITLTATGFGSEAVRIDFGTHQTITTAQANENGTFSITFVVDTQVANTRFITATGLETSEKATTIFQIQGKITSIYDDYGNVGCVVT
ncbi:MAG: hypothetical protein AAB296_00645, partial [Candidatus Desantisbacteria bacterium]